MIISPAQLRAINEATTFGGEFDGTVNDLNNQITQTKNDTTTGQTNGITSTQYINKNAMNNTTVVYDPTKPNITDPTALSQAKNVVVTTQNESRYSKRQVELGRMLEMRRTGMVYSKKQLNEMFMESQVNVKRLEDGLGNCLMHKIFGGIANIFGPDVEEEVKERFSNGEDPMMTIKDIFSREDSDKQEEFLDELGI